MSSPTGASVPLKKVDVLKVTGASMIGTMFDYYDFFVAGLAASVVWPTVFYPNVDPALALFLSVTSFAVGYLTRPLGSILFGHFGDKLGRLSTLIWSLITTGIGTAGIALTPSYASVGVVGAYLIVIFRLIQGVGAGGEWGGAATLVAEYAKDSKHRAFWVSWVQQGNALGTVVSTGVWAYLFVAMPRAQFFDWGWRIPFYIGVIVLFIGLVIRYSLLESPVFTQYVMKKRIGKFPIVELLRSEWKKVLIASAVPLIQAGSSGWITSVGTPFSVRAGVPAAVTANALVWGSIVGIFGLAGLALVADKLGRRVGLTIGGLVGAAFALPYMFMLKTGDVTLTIIATVLIAFFSRMGSGVFPAVLTEQFPARYRFTAAGLSYSLYGVWSSVVQILANYAFMVLGSPATSWIPLAMILVTINVLSVVAGLIVTRTKRQDITY